MKKIIFGVITLAACTSHAKEQVAWKHNGIYIVNKTDGILKIVWDDQERELGPALKALIPVSKSNVEIKISYYSTVSAYAQMPSCTGQAHTSLKTGKKIVLYEIQGGYDEGRNDFNRPATGPHCAIKVHPQAFTAKTAIQRYPDLK